MFDISNNNIITITRGDTAATTLYINLGTNLTPMYTKLGPADRLYFGIMEPNCSFEHALVKKVFTEEDHKDPEDPYAVCINFYSEDTENLLPGTYYYSVKLFRPALNAGGADRVDTIIPKRKFIILD